MVIIKLNGKIFWCMVQVGGLFSFFFFCMYQSSFPSTIYWRDCCCSIVCSWDLCPISIGHKGMGLFLGCLFWSINLYVSSYASTRLFWLQWPYIRSCDTFSFILLSQNCWGYLGSSVVPYKFGIFVLVLWNMPLNFNRKFVECVDGFG